jgi:hypothetical protein
VTFFVKRPTIDLFFAYAQIELRPAHWPRAAPLPAWLLTCATVIKATQTHATWALHKN